MKILLTDGSYKHTLGAARALKLEGHNVDILAEKNDVNVKSIFVDRVAYSQVDFENAPAEQFGDFLKKENYDVFLPIGAHSVLKASLNRELWGQYCSIPIASNESIDMCLDKKKTFLHAKKIGINIPKTWYFESLDQAIENINSINYPVVIKSRFENIKNFPTKYSHSAEDLKQSLSILYNTNCITNETFPLIQELIDGCGEGFFAVYENGECRSFFMHRRIRENPPSGGSSTCAISIYSEDLLIAGKALLDSLKWHGVAMVEFKRDFKSSQLYLMEINPKFWGSLDLAIESGINFPLLAAELEKKDQTIYPNKYKIGKKYHWPLHGEISHLLRKPSALFDIFADFLNSEVSSNIYLADWKTLVMQFKRQFLSFLKMTLHFLGSAILNIFMIKRFILRSKTIGFGFAFVRFFTEVTGLQIIKFSKITNEIFVGPQHSFLGKLQLKLIGVTAVLNLRSDFDDSKHSLSLEDYMNIKWPEYTSPDMADLHNAVEFINAIVKTKRKVFIHCREGISRAPTVVVAYFISKGFSLVQAVDIVKTKRPFINILPSQLEKLYCYEALIKTDNFVS